MLVARFRANVGLEHRPKPVHQEKVQKPALQRDVPTRRQFSGTHESNVGEKKRFASEAEGEVSSPEKLLKGTARHTKGRSQKRDVHQRSPSVLGEAKRSCDSVRGSAQKLGLEGRVGLA